LIDVSIWLAGLYSFIWDYNNTMMAVIRKIKEDENQETK